jgi:cytochrome c oxidase subunit 2
MDLVPGLVTYIWLTPTRIGEFEVLCEELCGVAHHAMRGMVVVDEQADFDTWLAQQPTYAQRLAKKPGNAQAGEAQYAVCATCHGAAGEGNQALNAPKLAGQGAWYMRRQLEYFKSGVRGAHEDDVFGQQMAAMSGMLVDEAAIENVITYIETLPNKAAQTTISGDVEAGRKIYVTCGACHGVNGEGIAATNAPRQAGMSDWYLANQLKNFREGVRGAHSGDEYGFQMVMMGAMLKDEDRINDVVAYINTLSGRKPQQNVAIREKH